MHLGCRRKRLDQNESEGAKAFIGAAVGSSSMFPSVLQCDEEDTPRPRASWRAGDVRLDTFVPNPLHTLALLVGFGSFPAAVVG